MTVDYFKLTTQSVAVIQKHSEAGELHAYVVENGHCHPVETSALKLIEWNLAQAGFSMGSCEATKMFLETTTMFLETTTMFPVCLNYDMLIYFPSESVKNASCVWLALHMVRDIAEQTPTTSRVLCYGHADIIVPVNVGSFKRRWHNALVFKNLWKATARAAGDS